jgi:hypothetical protein
MALLTAASLVVAAFLVCWVLLWKTGLSKVPFFRDLVLGTGGKDSARRRSGSALLVQGTKTTKAAEEPPPQ